MACDVNDRARAARSPATRSIHATHARHWQRAQHVQLQNGSKRHSARNTSNRSYAEFARA
eukprot:194695-Pleurochrysis_carterae.AAC.7